MAHNIKWTWQRRWTHRERDRERKMQTERGLLHVWRLGLPVTQSKLRLDRSEINHVGNYECVCRKNTEIDRFFKMFATSETILRVKKRREKIKVVTISCVCWERLKILSTLLLYQSIILCEVIPRLLVFHNTSTHSRGTAWRSWLPQLYSGQ